MNDGCDVECNVKMNEFGDGEEIRGKEKGKKDIYGADGNLGDI